MKAKRERYVVANDRETKQKGARQKTKPQYKRQCLVWYVCVNTDYQFEALAEIA